MKKQIKTEQQINLAITKLRITSFEIKNFEITLEFDNKKLNRILMQLKQLIFTYIKFSSIIYIMLDVINVKEKIPSLDEITTVKWILPVKDNQIIVVGYSKESVSNMQYIYELFDFKEQETKVKGRINNFGVIFLSDYEQYQEQGQFLMLCESMGTRKIIQQNFLVGVTSTLIKQIPKQLFQQEAKKQWSCIHYSTTHNKIYLLEISQFTAQETTLFFRVYQEDIEITSYRLICLESSFPKIVFSPQHILCLNEDEFVLYKENFQQIYFNIQNMDQFKIIGFFYEMILQFKQDKTIFVMSVSGTLRPLLEEFVVSFHINESHISFLYLKNTKYRIAVFEYRNKHVILKTDIDANVARGSIKSGGFRILGSNKHQIILSDTQTL